MLSVNLTRFLPVFSLLLLTALASVSTATLINPAVVLDTPTVWSGYVDWAQPATGSLQTIGLSSNWAVGVVEIPTGGGNAVLAVTARHLMEPHAPPSPPGFFLGAAFGPMMAGGSAGLVLTSQPHMDDPAHFDIMRVSLIPLNATTSRVNIDLTHADIPEPASMGLVGGAALLLLGIRRRLARP
jgi:hypothetical protein